MGGGRDRGERGGPREGRGKERGGGKAGPPGSEERQGGSNPGFDNTGGRIGAPVSGTNPGVSEGARGDASSDPNCQGAG